MFAVQNVSTDVVTIIMFFFFQAEDGIRDLVRSRGLGDVYKRQIQEQQPSPLAQFVAQERVVFATGGCAQRCHNVLPLSLIHI